MGFDPLFVSLLLMKIFMKCEQYCTYLSKHVPIEPRLMETFPSARKFILLEQIRNTGPCCHDSGSEKVEFMMDMINSISRIYDGYDQFYQ